MSAEIDVADLAALNRLAVDVPHDASGPPAINWALDHPDRSGASLASLAAGCQESEVVRAVRPGWHADASSTALT